MNTGTIYLRVELTEEAKITALWCPGPERLLAATATGMDRANQIVMRDLTMNHLTGKGPFPVEEHRLGIVTNRLRSSMRATAAQVDGNTVISSIGSNVVYAGAHEFGFDGEVTVRDHLRRVIQKRYEGRLLSNNDLARLGLLTKSGKLRKKVDVTMKPSIVTEHKRHMKIPARAPIRTSIEENGAVYGREISRAIVQLLGSY